jgi:Derlin-2/3
VVQEFTDDYSEYVGYTFQYNLFGVGWLTRPARTDPRLVIGDQKVRSANNFMNLNSVLIRYHIWRVLSSMLFLGQFSFGFVMQLYFFTHFGSRLETNARFPRPGDYVYYIFIMATLVSLMSLLVAWPRGYALTGPSVIFAMIYYWSRLEPEAPLSVWGFQVKGFQLPFALIFLSLLMGGDIWKDIVGLAAGHVYYFVKDILPLEYKVDILRTPRFFLLLVNKLSRAPAPAAVPAAGARWGEGRRLGGN